MVVESLAGNNSYQFYSYIREQISIALHSSQLFNEKTSAETKLRKANQKLRGLNSQLENLSLTDELTGLYNRRGFYYLCEQHHKVCQREGHEYLLFFADLDNLKQINDVHGHDEGDRVIRQTARLLQKTFRNPDIVARIGGDEFTILAISSEWADKDNIIGRLNRNIHEHNQKHNKPYELSLSIGYAHYTPDQDISFMDLLATADKMQYREKRKKKEQAKKSKGF
jgi:diguanylate cyclase (GGDEF)-like protein